MISRKEVLMDRDKQYPLSKEQELNLNDLLTKVNQIRKAYGKPLIVSSGYRPSAINSNVKGASKKSSHMSCQAVDFKDNGPFKKWCLDNLELLKANGLWMEDPRWTPTWVHLQSRKASKRVFLPFDPAKVPMTAPKSWDGKYDSKFD